MGSFEAKRNARLRLCLFGLAAGWFVCATPRGVLADEELVVLKAPMAAAPAAKQTYIVYMASQDGGESVGVASETATPASRYSALLKQAERRSSPGGVGVADAGSDEDTPLTYVYDSAAVQGFAAPMTNATADALQSQDEVLAVVPDGAVSPVTTRTPEFLGLTTGKLWPKSNQGRDVIIGVIDTGVWPESASFSDAGLGPIPRKWKGFCQEGARFTKRNCNKKLIGARYFYKGHQAKEGIDFRTQILSARDTQGHGSHCASTAAGASVWGANMNGLGRGGPARGIALQARLAVYKVCWRTCYDSDILAAYDAAVRDGVDVISISLGTDPRDYIVDSLAVGAFGAMKAGIFVSHPAGNNGGMASTVTNVAPWAMTVAASTIDRSFFAGVQLGNKSKYLGKSWTTGNWGPAFFPLVRGRNARASGFTPDDADNCLPLSLNARLVRGKIVVCQRENWDSDPIEKAQTVKDAGGRGLIVIDFRDFLEPVHYVLPTVCVGSVAGGAILSYMARTQAPTANLYPDTVLGVKPAPAIAAFSSRGPSYINPRLLKPDIAAPGVDILAAWTENSAPSFVASDRNRIKFNIMSGTSMATPHVAGLAALLKAAYPAWSPASIKSALMTTASVTDNTRQRVTDAFLDGAAATPFDYGAGHVVPEKALNPGLLYDLGARDYINFLCAYGYSAKQVQVFNGAPTTCPRIPVRVEDFNYPSFTATFKASQLKPLTVSFTRTVTNVGPAAASYTASSRAPAGARITIRPSVLAFSRSVRRKTFTVTVTTAGPPRSGYGSITWTGAGVTAQSPLVITPSVASN